MRGLFEDAAICTKIRHMDSRFLDEEALLDLARSSHVGEAIRRLKKYGDYGEIFDDAEPEKLHRDEIERRLLSARFRDFAKLYRFANMRQRRFLDTYFMRYEIMLLKRIMRNSLHLRKTRMDLSEFSAFFSKHSGVDFERLMEADSFPLFLEGLRNTPFYRPLLRVETAGKGIMEYELALDLLYFKSIWWKDKGLLDKRERLAVLDCFGTTIDLLNIKWIYRSKKYYGMDPAHVYALLIPSYYRLQREDVRRLAEAPDLEAFFEVFDALWYGRMERELFSRRVTPEELSDGILDRLYTAHARKNPQSLVVLNTYLYRKERELELLVNLTEAIRYQTPYETIRSDIIRKKERPMGA